MSGEIANGEYCWSITDSKIIDKIDKIEPGERLDSEIFEIASSKWFLRLFPNGTKRKYEGRVSLFLQLCSLPLFIKKLKIKLVLSCNETNTTYSDIKYFSNEREFGGWTGGILTTNELKKYKKLTFMVSIIIIEKILNEDVINNESQQQSKQYLLQKENSYSHSQQHPQQQIQIQPPPAQIQQAPSIIHYHENMLNSLSINMLNVTQQIKNISNLIQNINFNLQQKQNKIVNLQKDIDKIKNKLEIDDDEEEENKNNLYSWLKNDVNLFDEYYDIFIQNGLDDMTTVCALTDKELDLIGIHKIGHKIKIIQEINKYKLSQMEQEQDDDNAHSYHESNKSVSDVQSKQ